MSSNKAHAIQFAIMPRDPKLPADILELASIADLSINPSRNIDRLNRADLIIGLIEETLQTARKARKAA